jgi:hypothetical protein
VQILCKSITPPLSGSGHECDLLKQQALTFDNEKSWPARIGLNEKGLQNHVRVLGSKVWEERSKRKKNEVVACNTPFAFRLFDVLPVTTSIFIVTD